ncbi:Nuclear receptor 2C2-associated protein TR4 orphan receptor-associated 16 kDa protein -like protein [Takifugu flavidus]|uniref:Nuclear receptor 2C2-associated protein TR4 orphan receptor-associated 16 kDa protein-like protein n=1 Tax=Takifugu flavidus TaxID=433684 RepID=A0A5C6MU97_9TELE|nr:Nuclear receptor 2C2-associated protein TR4 orphan receptor-associated 16 kDa protein -like protein [Takifugu flavidus]
MVVVVRVLKEDMMAMISGQFCVTVNRGFFWLDFRVSSVLNRDVKQYGKKYLFDCNEETCWNSDQGERQWVILEFPQSVKVSELRIQFQGGFSAGTCRLEGCQKEGDFNAMGQFYPEDNNCLQISFSLTVTFECRSF